MYETYEAILAFLAASGASYTVADAEEGLSFPLERLLKTVAFISKTGPYVLAAVRGPDHIDYRRLAAAVGTKRTNIARLTPEEVVEVFGVEVGSVSPIALRENVVIFFDTKVTTDETVFCGIGRPDRTL